MKYCARLVPIISMLFVLTAMAQDSPATLAETLVRLRGQVDSLQSALDIEREEHKNRMVNFTAQLADIEANRDRENLRITQIQKNLDETREKISAAGLNAEAFLPAIYGQISALRARIANGLPFKTRERLDALDKLEVQMKNGETTPQRGINRLWAFVEDELRISRENAIYSQPIALNGNSILVDVAKLGNVMMFFRTKDLKYGRAIHTDVGWRFELLKSSAEQEQVAVLFDSLRKQIRQGYFELPAALPPQADKQS